jgi:hypothetical protein
MLVAILHLVNDMDNPQQIVGRLMEAMAPGSYLAITHVPGDMQESMGVVTQFFDGLELLPPGVVPVQERRPSTAEESRARAAMWGGVARKNA